MEKNIKILVIEDDLGVIDVLNKNLIDEGYEVYLARDGKKGEELAVKNKFDIILMDIIMPKMNGLELCKKLKSRKGFSTPILMLSALGTSENIVDGFEIGADDYVTKPFKFKVLNARIKALLRRTNTDEVENVLVFEDIKLDLDSKDVFRGDNQITLTNKEFNLFKYLLINKTKVLSREDILKDVWNINFDISTNVVDVYINYLRNKIDKNYERKYIQTVPGHGFVIK